MRWLERFRSAPPAVDERTWGALFESSALLRTLDPPRRVILHDLVARFLSEKRFHAAADHVIDEHQRVAIAAMACLPVLQLGAGALKGWRDIIVYPGGFRSRREHHDESTGVVTRADEDMIGEAWEYGPVVLSWADVAEDLEHPFDGFNVVIHEIAHKLDMLDGAMNGVPRLPASIARQRWIGTMQAAYDAFVAAVEEGDDVAIDDYAAESPEEFFAVATEYHHSAPDILSGAMPDVARLLADYYGPAPGV